MSDSLSNGPISNFEEIESSADVNQLRELDSFLKCSICYEYFNTCVITECSHNFCSLCIRRYIQFKTECPVCFSELYDSHLRANRVIDNFVGIFPQLKERVIRRIRTLKTLKPNCLYVSPSKNDAEVTTPISKKRQIIPDDVPPQEDSQSLFMEPVKKTPKISHTPNSVSKNKVVIPKIFQSPVKKNTPTPQHCSVKMVQCPICSVDIPERNINLHLDVCLTRQNNASEKKDSKTANMRKHLPKLVLRLLSVTALRAKAKDYGLNSHGDAETLKNRIQKFTVLYNSECDKPIPRPVSEIIGQLEREEKVLANQKLPKSMFSVQSDNVSKEELNALYIKENKNNFDNLIKNVRTRESAKANSSNTVVEPKNASTLIVEHCEPSTSTAVPTWCHTNREKKDTEELKPEDIKDEPFVDKNCDSCDMNVNENCDQLPDAKNVDDDESSNYDVVFSVWKKRSRRLNFDSENEDCKDDTVPFMNLEGNKDLLEVLIDENHDVKNISFGSEVDEIDSSPVLQRKTRRKRTTDEALSVVPKKNTRKRKR